MAYLKSTLSVSVWGAFTGAAPGHSLLPGGACGEPPPSAASPPAVFIFTPKDFPPNAVAFNWIQSDY